MATPSYARSLICATKRLRISPPQAIACVHNCGPRYQHSQAQPSHHEAPADLSTLRLPRAVQATYLAPLKRTPTHSIPSASLQLRSYSLRNLELYADFALRAAYYLHLPATGPVPLPKITERWTVPRSNFIFKKSQENFERKTLRRLITIYDGDTEIVSLWLAFLRKNRYFGVGMKANVFEYQGLDEVGGKVMDADMEKLREQLEEKLNLVGGRPKVMEDETAVEDMLMRQPFKAQWGAYAPMGGSASVPSADKRIERQRVAGEQ